MTLHEPAVALTDFGLALECAVFAVLLLRRPWAPPAGERRLLRLWWVAFFLLVGVAAALGGVVHGFPPAPGPGRDGLWLFTLLAIGMAGVQAFRIAASMWLSGRGLTVALHLGNLALCGYVLALVLGHTRFWIAIIAYFPAALFLGAAFARDAARGRPGAGAGVAGIALTLLAAAAQQGRVGLHPTYFDHNALYHVLQAVGLVLLFRAARATLPRHEVKR
jgi:hypothetical protein